MSQELIFAEEIIQFLKGLEFKDPLPEGISIMNPYRDNPEIIPVISKFYNKFYNDSNLRYLILGINPGRFGAGVTGIPFTDSKRLSEKCGLSIPGVNTFETSSVFVYETTNVYDDNKSRSHDPVITWLNANELEIAVDRVGRITRQIAESSGIKIIYRIGSVDYP